jgi:hypothetical protein
MCRSWEAEAMAVRTEIYMGANERLSLADAVSSFQSLIVLDHAWTGLASTIEQPTDNDEDVLASLIGSILRDLDRAREGAAWLQDYVLQIGLEELRSAALAAAEDLPDGIASVIQDVDETYGDQFGAFTEDCYVSLRDGLREQRSTLVRELAELLSGEPSDGDLFKNILCGVAAGMTIGGVIATAVPPHVQGPIIVGAGAVALKAFKCDLEDLDRKSKWRLVK